MTGPKKNLMEDKKHPHKLCIHTSFSTAKDGRKRFIRERETDQENHEQPQIRAK